MKKAFVYFPYPPFPVQSGGQWRCASMITALISNGYKVFVVSPGVPSPRAQQSASDHGVSEMITFQPLSIWKKIITKIKRQFKVHSPEIPHSENKQLLRLLSEVTTRHGKFDIFLNNYTDNKWVRNYIKSEINILDTLDLISVSSEINRFAFSHLDIKKNQILSYSPSFLDLDFYKNSGSKPSDVELEGCIGYDAVIMIADKEKTELEKKSNDLALEMIPPSARSQKRTGTYSYPPLFASGPNIFNIQGLMAFQKNVLPLILSQCPEFILHVTGQFTLQMNFQPQVHYLGLVPNIDEIYQRSGFSIIPTFGGTGQQLKVVEAMGAGLAVVAYAQRVDSGIIDHGIDGFAAKDETEFANCVIRLINDVDLRRRMGQAAHQKIENFYSQKQTNLQLATLIETLKSRT